MIGELLPLFPLRMVAFPNCSVPLHIFEERYKAMVGLSLKNGSEFGIVLAEGKGIVNVGCTVSIDAVVERYDDGRLDIVCVGKRRFEILTLDQEEDLLRASVQYFDDDDSASTPALRLEALSAWEQAKPLLQGRPQERIDPTVPQLSFRLADAVPELDARQVFLELRSEEERLKQIAAYFGGYASRLARITHARRVAPTNGHAALTPRDLRHE
ncbi:MAG: LON peptidase substrate-binding domain-containing protein [Bryobacterales bacterium]|nr:LON peptidase substrate-binding domain-containing protein [Bryobacterales bacterium]